MQNFNWLENYYIARVLLGFSEDEFWQAHPRKITALFALKQLRKGTLRHKESNAQKAQEIINILQK